MKIYMQKIGMIRPDSNPKNSNLNLDIDWSVEYYDTHQDQIRFNMILKSLNQFRLDFKVEGLWNYLLLKNLFRKKFLN